MKVKNGYGRNFLLPQKKALRATDANKAVFEARRADIEAHNASTRTEAEKQAKKLGTVTLKIVRQASEDGKLYGSVGPRDILDALKEQGGHSFDRKQIDSHPRRSRTPAASARRSCCIPKSPFR